MICNNQGNEDFSWSVCVSSFDMAAVSFDMAAVFVLYIVKHFRTVIGSLASDVNQSKLNLRFFI